MSKKLKLTINLGESREFGTSLSNPNHPLHSFEVKPNLGRWVPTSDYVYACLRKFYPSGYTIVEGENHTVKLSGNEDQAIHFTYNAEKVGD